MTSFQPSDCDDGPELMVELERPCSFSFESLLESEHLIEFSGVILISIAELHLLSIVVDFVLEYTFTYMIRGLDRRDAGAMVEYSMSRFKKGIAETDEPLAILTLVTFVEQEMKMTLERQLRNALNTSNAAYWGILFEGFGAYLLAHAFSAP